LHRGRRLKAGFQGIWDKYDGRLAEEQMDLAVYELQEWNP